VPFSGAAARVLPGGRKGWETITRRSSPAPLLSAARIPKRWLSNYPITQLFNLVRHELIVSPTLSRKLKAKSQLPRKNGPSIFNCEGHKKRERLGRPPGKFYRNLYGLKGKPADKNILVQSLGNQLGQALKGSALGKEFMELPEARRIAEATLQGRAPDPKTTIALKSYPIEQEARKFSPAAAEKAEVYCPDHSPDELIYYFNLVKNYYRDAVSKKHPMLSWID